MSRNIALIINLTIKKQVSDTMRIRIIRAIEDILDICIPEVDRTPKEIRYILEELILFSDMNLDDVVEVVDKYKKYFNELYIGIHIVPTKEIESISIENNEVIITDNTLDYSFEKDYSSEK